MSLHDLIRKLEREEKTGPKISKRGEQVLDSRKLNNYGKYQVPPVFGPIVSDFGQKHKKMDIEGIGIVYRTRQNSHVSSPVHGQIVYAGDFRGYKQILIIAHDNGFHTLLTGMHHVNVSVGQTVLAGEPVGVMGPESPEYLYLELRKDGKPVNPSKWLKT
jgi:septal ring factor EnvC (AmiA/AmiB activator)